MDQNLSHYLLHMQVEEDDEDIDQDPDYEPSDTTMMTDNESIITPSVGTDPRSGIVSNVSEIYPGDSISVREMPIPRGYNPRTRGSDESESVSLETFHSSANDRFYRPFFGREFTTMSDHYMLPVDEPEHYRHNVQHHALRLRLGGLYASKALVQEALRPNQNPPPAVLDVGTGSGIWAIDMAKEFPHAEIVGIDFAPPAGASEIEIPENCRFEVDDANESMAHYDQKFNVVHVRSVDPGINDFEALLYELARTMRPGAVLLLSTAIPQIMSYDGQPFPVTEPGQPGFTWLQFYLAAAYDAYRNRGNTAVDSALHWQQWLEKNPNYSRVETRDVPMPMSTFKGMSETELRIGGLFLENVESIIMAFKPLLLNDNQRPDDVDLWVVNAVNEVKENRIHGQLMWRYTTAVRGGGPWQEKLERPRPLEEPEARLITKRVGRSPSSNGTS